ncbi:MAG: hypothetical protein M1826_007696 [Phylliscum demangeonii]|nr:MAG: hypothetical protein M1826_007696 [Phylliscum demangeonii]
MTQAASMSRSPPATPSPPCSGLQIKQMFETMMDPTEWIEDYHPGGFHPVRLDEVFNDRYRVIRKLGYGSFSTVWLAVDAKRHGYVALKIVEAASSDSSHELSMFNKLKHNRASAAGAAYLIELRESFTHKGPNGTHLCLAFEVMGPHLMTMTEELGMRANPKGLHYGYRLPVRMAKVILRQLLLALAFLHQNNIVHADVQPGNILFSVDLDSVPEEHLRQDYKSKDDPLFERLYGNRVRSKPVKRRDGKLDRWAPSHLLYDRPLTSYVRLTPKPTVKLSDLGAAFPLSDPPKKTVTPSGLRAPELIFGLPFDQTIDIWSLGCLAFGFLAGTPLFAVGGFRCNQQKTDDDHLLGITSKLGDLPDSLFAKWTRADRYFGPNRKLMNSMIDTSCEEMSDEEERSFINMLRQMLQYDPSKRPSASKLLQHPWLATADPFAFHE